MSMHRFIVILIILFVPLSARSDKGSENSAKKLYFNDSFFQEYRNIPDVMKDAFWKERLNYIVTARGTVTDIRDSNKYKKKYRIEVKDNDSAKFGQNFIYYVYIENQNSYEMLSVNEVFEFSGQLMAYTPLSVNRDNYIFDILIEKGAILVK